jgi:hypothetical protein
MAKQYLSVPRHWVKLNNNYHLLIAVGDRVFTTTYIVYDEVSTTADMVKLNKTIREGNLIERIQHELDIKVRLYDPA